MNEMKKELEEVRSEPPRKEEESLVFSFDDKEKALFVKDQEGARIPTLEENISFLTTDRGADIIARQGMDGHQLEVSNIRVHNAATLLEQLNTAGRKENIPPEVLKDLGNQYLMTAVIDGQTVSKVISERQFYKTMAFEDFQKFRFCNFLFGIQPGNSVNVPDVQYSQRDSMPFSIVNAQELREKIREFINTDTEMQKRISPKDREELNKMLSDPVSAEEMKNKMFLVADTEDGPMIYPVTMEESIKIEELGGKEREKYAAAINAKYAVPMSASKEPEKEAARRQNNDYLTAKSPMEMLLKILATWLGLDFLNPGGTSQQTQPQQQTAPEVTEHRNQQEGQGLEPVHRPRKDEDMLAYSFNDKEKALFKIDKDGVRIPTLAEDISFVTTERGADIIAKQGVNGHVLEVSNVNVHNAATLLERLNIAGCKENIPPEVLKDLEHKYIMTAVVDGKDVTKVITEQQFDKAMSLDDSHKFLYFNMVFGIDSGNSVQVPDIRYPQRHTMPVQLTEKSSQALAMEIVKKQAWYRRAVENGTELNVTPISIGKDGNGGTTELKIEVNGSGMFIVLAQKEYDNILNANKAEDNALRPGTNANNFKDMAGNAYSEILEENEAAQSQEQSMGMSR